MTSTQEPPRGEGREVHPLFARVLEPYLAAFNLDAGSEQMIEHLLVRGTREVRRIPEGADRDAAIEAAAQRLDVALQRASAEFESVGRVDIDVDTLTVVMQAMCPVPPFCAGIGGPEGGGVSAGVGDAAARAEPELVEAY